MQANRVIASKRRSLPARERKPFKIRRYEWAFSRDCSFCGVFAVLCTAIGIYKATIGQYSENEFSGPTGHSSARPGQGIDETLALYEGLPAGK